MKQDESKKPEQVALDKTFNDGGFMENWKVTEQLSNGDLVIHSNGFGVCTVHEVEGRPLNAIDVAKEIAQAPETARKLAECEQQRDELLKIADSAQIVVDSEGLHKVDHPGVEVSDVELTELECLLNDYNKRYGEAEELRRQHFESQEHRRPGTE